MFMLHRIITILLLVLAAALPACGNHRPPGIYPAGSRGDPVTFIEDGQLVSLYIKPCYNEFTTTTWIKRSFLSEENNTNLRRLWETAPAWRCVENLAAVGRRLTADQPRRACRVLFSSHNPVVVGIVDLPDAVPHGDPFDESYFFLSGNPRNLWLWSHPHYYGAVVRLYVCRSWPEPDVDLGIPDDREVIVLPRPTSAEELLRTRPWDKPTAVPTTVD